MSNYAIGTIFIDNNKKVVYTIVDVKYYNTNKDTRVFSYTVHRTDRNTIDVINDWWLDDYAEKVC
jgi:hypothetical protein